MDRYSSASYQAKSANDQGLIEYTQAEHAMWSELYQAQIGLVNRHMANKYKEGLATTDLPSGRIPQCHEVSETLQKTTGWQVVPVPALIGYQRFFGMLAARQFPAASFIRKPSDFGYVKEPDIFHEIFGHTPLLVDPTVADFSQAMGQLGVAANPDDHVWLARLYWFTIEFGLIREQGLIKPLGSGLASSPTELLYAATSPTPVRKPFDLLEVLRTPYRIDIKQPIYYVLEGIDHLREIIQDDIMSAIKQAKQLGLRPAHPELLKAI